MEIYSPFNYQEVEMPQYQMSSTSPYQSTWIGPDYADVLPQQTQVIHRAKPGGGTGGQDTENPYIKTEPIGSGVGVMLLLLVAYTIWRRLHCLHEKM